MKIIENDYKGILLDPNYINGIRVWLNSSTSTQKGLCPFIVGQDCKICQKIFPKLLKKYSKTNEQTKRNYRYKCPCGVYTIQ